MEKKVKLSPAMKEVIGLMKNSCYLYSNIHHAQVSKTFLSYTRKEIRTSTVEALHNRGLITSNKTIAGYFIFELTDLGKSITI